MNKSASAAEYTMGYSQEFGRCSIGAAYKATPLPSAISRGRTAGSRLGLRAGHHLGWFGEGGGTR